MCAIPIQHRLSTLPDPNNAHYNDYKAWAAGDTTLDWHGRQPAQPATSQGTPTFWTTNDQSNTPPYNQLNQ